MKIFVTVGTTRFDALIKAVDEKLFDLDYEVTMQIADGIYKPKHFNHFEYTRDIQKYFSEADVVISHAGAGSIYELLDLGKKIIIVPNFDRIDKHQSDITDYMDSNGYAKALYDLENLEEAIRKVHTSSFKEFKKESFFKVHEIIDFVS
jgi:UDP-N-acetylglucosamine transferase subunit ALG13